MQPHSVPQVGQPPLHLAQRHPQAPSQQHHPGDLQVRDLAPGTQQRANHHPRRPGLIRVSLGQAGRAEPRSGLKRLLKLRALHREAVQVRGDIGAQIPDGAVPPGSPRQHHLPQRGNQQLALAASRQPVRELRRGLPLLSHPAQPPDPVSQHLEVKPAPRPWRKVRAVVAAHFHHHHAHFQHHQRQSAATRPVQAVAGIRGRDLEILLPDRATAGIGPQDLVEQVTQGADGCPGERSGDFQCPQIDLRAFPQAAFAVVSASPTREPGVKLRLEQRLDFAYQFREEALRPQVKLRPDLTQPLPHHQRHVHLRVVPGDVHSDEHGAQLDKGQRHDLGDTDHVRVQRERGHVLHELRIAAHASQVEHVERRDLPPEPHRPVRRHFERSDGDGDAAVKFSQRGQHPAAERDTHRQLDKQRRAAGQLRVTDHLHVAELRGDLVPRVLRVLKQFGEGSPFRLGRIVDPGCRCPLPALLNVAEPVKRRAQGVPPRLRPDSPRPRNHLRHRETDLVVASCCVQMRRGPHHVIFG